MSKSTDERLRRTFELLQAQLRRESEEPVAPVESAEELLARLDLRVGEAVERLFATLDALVAATPRTTTRRFFNQLFSGRDDFGVIGELIASFLNSSMYTFKAAGPQVIVEREVTRRMAELVGFDQGEGLFVPGGSLSNMVGMILARNAHRPEGRNEGFHGAPLTLYASRQSHYSLPKNAGMMGLGRDNVREVDIDSEGCMRPDALRERIQADREAGLDPFLIVATAGTTVLGAFDPIDAIADVAEEFGLRLHVDGALGGSVSFSARHRGMLAGSDRADSFTWNAHKMLGVPLAASVILTKRRGELHGSFDEQASYLFQDAASQYEHGTMSIQCGRRNDALKFWASWKSHGDAGLGARVDHLFDLARYAAARVESDDALVLSKDPSSVTVCFEVRGRSSEDVCERLRLEGRDLVGYGVVDGRRVVRLALVNGAMDRADVDAFFDDVLAVAAHSEQSDNAIEAAAE